MIIIVIEPMIAEMPKDSIAQQVVTAATEFFKSFKSAKGPKVSTALVSVDGRYFQAEY